MFKVSRVYCVFSVALLLVGSGEHGAKCFGQYDPGSVAKINHDGGFGTCFAVKTDGKNVELWTAAHCVGNVGSEATITWATGQITRATVEWRATDNNTDAAKLVGPKPSHIVACLRIAGGVPARKGWHFHVGYGSEGRQCSKSITFTANRFSDHTGFKPACIPGDSGGPVVDMVGDVVGVVTARDATLRRQFGLFDPISNWTPDAR